MKEEDALSLNTKTLIPFDVVPVSGTTGGEAFLVITEKSAFLVEAGFAFSAGKLIENLQTRLGGRRLDYILLTHSHYDHAGGASAVKRAYPDAIVVSSRHAAWVFQREHARQKMRELDQSAAAFYGLPHLEDMFPLLKTDLCVDDGDVIETEDVHVRVIASPGHTRCSVSYYFEEFDLLAASESSGVLIHGINKSSYIVSYRQTQQTIDGIDDLAPAYLISPHHGLVSGTEAEAYAGKAREAAAESAGFILSCYREGKSSDEIIAAYTEKYYNLDLLKSGLQPEYAFMINTTAMIPRLIREYENEEENK
jgi:glyoxylase-like metal-dependent hydrolase (beta-lactamase superfamily II)